MVFMHRRLVLFMIIILVLVQPVLASVLPYADVSSGVWYEEAVEYVTSHGLMQGIGNNRFAPNADVTRSMMVTILYRMEGQPPVGPECPFQDVPDSGYYKDAVTWAAQAEIINGYGDGRFNPNWSITREQIATVFYRYANYKGFSTVEKESITAFADAELIHSYALPAMEWAYAGRLMIGTNNRMDPQGFASRCQAAALLMRFSRSFFPEETDTPDETPSSAPDTPGDGLLPSESVIIKDSDTPKLIVEEVLAEVGSQQVHVLISIENNPGILGMILSVTYDDQALELVSCENGLAFRDVLTLTPPGKYSSPCRFLWDGQDITDTEIQDGEILTLVFHIRADARPGKYPICVSYSTGDIVDNSLNSVTPAVSNGSVTV